MRSRYLRAIGERNGAVIASRADVAPPVVPPDGAAMPVSVANPPNDPSSESLVTVASSKTTASTRTAPMTRSVRERLLGRGREHVAADRAVLVLRDVTKTYPNGKTALRDVDLVIPEGDFVF